MIQRDLNAKRCKWVFNACLICFALSSSSVYGHERLHQDPDAVSATQAPIAISGQVTDVANSPIAGVSILLKSSSSVGTSTDGSGSFNISADPDGVLLVSFAGYKSQEVAINGRTTINIILQDSVEMMDEVVVVGYGVQKRASITGSVASIQAEELVKVKTPNVTNMLAGRLPGIRAAQRSGAPGDDGASVDIRGYGSMLVIVDGVQRDFAQLDANDIESISILKDASAAVYGFKGSNGVLLVTTKKGTKERTKLEYNGYYGLQDVTRYPRMMSAFEYASLYNEAIYNSNPYTGVPAYSQEQLDSYKSGEQGTDWWNALVRGNAPQTSHNLSIYGGNDKVTYYNSIGYVDQSGILKSDDWTFKRYNLRSNVDLAVTPNFSVGFKLSGRIQDRNKPYGGDDLFTQAQMALPIYSIYANNNPNYWQAIGNMANPVHSSYIENSGYESRLRREFNGSLDLNWKLPWVSGLSVRAMVAYDYKNSEWKTWQKALSDYQYNQANDVYTEVALREKASLESKMENLYMPTQQYSINYNHVFAGKHDVSGLLLWEAYHDRLTDILGFRESSIGIIDDISKGDTENQNTSGKSVETAHAGLVGRFNYAFDRKYLLELNFRYDGSYKFQADRRWGFFPGASLGWRISEEDFFKESLPQFDNVKIRGSYAKVGDEGDFSAYQYLDGYVYGGSYVLGTSGLSSGLVASGMANPWLTWYESQIMNFGFEASFKNGLISTEFDWFRRERTGLPATRQGTFPTSFGESMPQENLNSDINSGFEWSVGHKNKIGEFSYNVAANFSVTRIRYGYVERANSTNMFTNWQDNNNDRNKDIRWGRTVLGQFGSYEEILNSPLQDNNGNRSLLPGDLKFKDVNEDGIIDGNDVEPIGRGATPRMYYGLNLGANYKGFDMTMFFQGAAGHDIYISGDILDPFIQQGLGNGFAFMTDRWHRADPADPNSEWRPGNMPAARVTGQVDNRSDNSWSLHNADYLRLKTLEIGYTLPQQWTQSLNIERCRFYFNGNNLLTFTGDDELLKNIDPESNQSRLRYYPQLRTFNLGVNLVF
ncbi:TonB-dependent receptor [Sphingobacterium sp. JB170]|uniref:SusC/RagA family TonB-linked outer membrane protein n=1 Tax=Sphingobacterium sp. JB170 TaxID=1434842 RepID=UPI00097F0C74|nr:TonB-dependent receptor [Sphingobacterium sp. JB170]SJN46573.1 TonB family protein / TonB-dependent receptor [Sphingobacterium sp. JB170]